MRIAFVAPVFAPMVGGAERTLTALATHLSARNAVAVLTPVVQTGTFPFPVLPVRAWRVFGRQIIDPISTFAALRRFRPDAIVSSGPDPIEVFVPTFARALGCTAVSMYHADLDTSKPLSALYNRFHWRLLRAFDTVNVQSEGLADHLASKGVARRTLDVIPPGLNEAFFAEAPQPPLRDTVLFVGRLDEAHRYKRLDVLLAALALLPAGSRPRSVVVGDGDLRASFERQARDLRLADVLFLGSIGDAALRAEYARAAAMVLPSVDAREGLGLVVLEALLSGAVPIVTTGHPNVKEFLTYGAVAVAPDDPAALADAIRGLCGGAAGLPEGARERAARRYSWSASTASWEARLRTSLRGEGPE